MKHQPPWLKKPTLQEATHGEEPSPQLAAQFPHLRTEYSRPHKRHDEMSVAELIAILQTAPQDAVVMVDRKVNWTRPAPCGMDEKGRSLPMKEARKVVL